MRGDAFLSAVNKYSKIVAGCVIAVTAILLLFIVAGTAFGPVIMAVFVIAVSIVLGVRAQLVGAIIIVLLMSMLGNEVSTLLRIWIDAEKITQTTQFFTKMSYFRSALVIFTILTTLTIITRSLRLLHINVNDS